MFFRMLNTLKIKQNLNTRNDGRVRKRPNFFPDIKLGTAVLAE